MPPETSTDGLPSGESPTESKVKRQRSERLVSESPQMGLGVLPPMPVSPRSPLRALLDDYLRWAASKRNVAVYASFDATEFSEFAARCKREGKRPPSLVAYVLRCAGVVFDKNREVMATKHKNGLYVPQQVNIALVMISSVQDGGTFPLMLELAGVESKNLAEISAELAQTSRGLRRQALQHSPKFHQAVQIGRTPRWMRRALLNVGWLFPKFRAAVAFHSSHVGITSLTAHMRGRAGWGLSLLPYSFNLTLGGLSKRAVVRGDEVVARECLDITFMIDHEILDGAPGLDVMHQFGEEFESGRLLSEF